MPGGKESQSAFGTKPVSASLQVQQLEDRLNELEEERKELARFQQVDKQRRSLEYTIYDKDVTETSAKLEQVITLSYIASAFLDTALT